jgi:hypothetical protein
MTDARSDTRTFPPAVFLGYCAKRYGPLPEHHDWGVATEVCSTSGCIAGHAPAWFDDPFKPPVLNRAGCTNTAAAARERVPELKRFAYRIFAYRAIPMVFDKAPCTLEVVSTDALFVAYSYLADLPSEQALLGFDHLGFDVVQYSDAINWGCSPLTCNYMYQHHPINQYCLIDTVEGAVEAARSFAQNEPEPGPYIVIEVFRERESALPIEH